MFRNITKIFDDYAHRFRIILGSIANKCSNKESKVVLWLWHITSLSFII